MSMLTLNDTQATDVHILEWFADRQGELGQIAQFWWGQIKDCGEDVLEVLHDGAPTACVDEYPFAYVGLYKAHVNVGFYYGAELADPECLLLGSGKRMRHVKLFPDKQANAEALRDLINAAYADIQHRVRS